MQIYYDIIQYTKESEQFQRCDALAALAYLFMKDSQFRNDIRFEFICIYQTAKPSTGNIRVWGRHYPTSKSRTSVMKKKIEEKIGYIRLLLKAYSLPLKIQASHRFRYDAQSYCISAIASNPPSERNNRDHRRKHKHKEVPHNNHIRKKIFFHSAAAMGRQWQRPHHCCRPTELC